ncbi:MAG: SDR family oxidoreductase [Kiloniellales bacterium]|nr:SDR family oxidoreductase [Kiloniellales bacterium]
MPTALITGANRGLGLEFTRSFLADSWHVHACCRYPEKSKGLKGLEGDLDVHRLDVTDGLKVANLSRELVGGPIDLVLNNAGVYGPRTGFGETDYDLWEAVFRINSIAPLRMAERFVEQVAASERKLIVNISSIMGSIGQLQSSGSYFYRASKAALNMVTKGLSVDLAARGITVVAVHPGWVQTDMGGTEADLTATQSIAGLRAVIESLDISKTGRFFNYDGSELPW